MSSPEPTPPLVQTLKSLIERSYGMAPIIHDLGPYLVGDAGYARLYGGDRPETARVLVRQGDGAVRAALYYPDALIRHLERFNPARGLGDVNIEAFAVLVEELDHLLTLASRAAENRPVTLLELEHHAHVTKYLVVVHFLGRQTRRRRIDETFRRWARHHLFERYADPAGAGARYRDAARMARRYVAYLDRLPVAARHAELRALQRRAFPETLRLLSRISLN